MPYLVGIKVLIELNCSVINNNSNKCINFYIDRVYDEIRNRNANRIILNDRC